MSLQILGAIHACALAACNTSCEYIAFDGCDGLHCGVSGASGT